MSFRVGGNGTASTTGAMQGSNLGIPGSGAPYSMSVTVFADEGSHSPGEILLNNQATALDVDDIRVGAADATTVQLICSVSGGAYDQPISSSGILVPGQWQTVTMVREHASSLLAYVDGVLAVSSTNDVSNRIPQTSFRFGHENVFQVSNYEWLVCNAKCASGTAWDIDQVALEAQAWCPHPDSNITTWFDCKSVGDNTIPPPDLIGSVTTTNAGRELYDHDPRHIPYWRNTDTGLAESWTPSAADAIQTLGNGGGGAAECITNSPISTSGDYAVAFWFNSSGTPGTNEWFWENTKNSSTSRDQVRFQDGGTGLSKISYECREPGLGTVQIGGTGNEFPRDAWTYLGWGREGDNIWAGLNGSRYGIASAPVSGYVASAMNFLGGNGSFVDHPQYQAANVKIWEGRTLTESEFAAEMVSTEPVVTSGIWGHYLFASGALATDSTGNGNDWTVVNTPSSIKGRWDRVEDHALSSAIQLTASDSQYLGITSDLPDSKADYTVGFWYYHDATDASQGLFNIGNTSWTESDAIHIINNDEIRLYRYAASVGTAAASLAVLTNATWHYIVIKGEATGPLTCFVDFDQAVTVDDIPTSRAADTAMRINRLEGGAHGGNGKYSSVKFWTKLKSMKDMMLESMYTTPIDTTDLYDYWPLEGNANGYWAGYDWTENNSPTYTSGTP